MRQTEPAFEYRQDKSIEDHVVNWFVTMDLMCLPEIEYTIIPSFFFIGYGIGIMFFLTPELLGRKKAMNFSIPPLLISICLVIYSKNITVMKVGFFM
jgi:hypothetical protein